MFNLVKLRSYNLDESLVHVLPQELVNTTGDKRTVFATVGKIN